MSRPPSHPAGWLWMLGAATIVTAARWREIALHGGEIPYLDQWLVEGRQVLVPWLDGSLRPADFFASHHEHFPVWTRLLVWLEAVLGGQWNGQFQATINAVLTGGFVGAACAWLRRELALIPALVLSGLMVVLYSLPHSWENIAWGFQAHMPLALLFVFLHVRGSFVHASGSVGWWRAQAAGLAVLGTLGSMWAAPLAVLVVSAWTRRADRRQYLSTGLLTAVGIGLLVFARIHQPHTGAYAQGPADLSQFLTALLSQLGWPSVWPGIALLLSLPALLLALRLRKRPDAHAVDMTILALVGWAAAQAVAFAYARGSYAGFVSRYGDLLALGVLANGVALWRLLSMDGWRWRLFIAVIAAAWAAAVGIGLRKINTEGHTKYYHEHSAAWSQLRSETVRQYLSTKDPAHLSGPDQRSLLFPDPALVQTVLDQPRLAPLLSANVQSPDTTPARARFLSDFTRDLRSWWAELAWSGGLLLLAGAVLTAQAGTRQMAPRISPIPSDHSAWIVFGLLSAGSAGLLLCWSQPLEFRTERRWAPLLSPPGTLGGLSFRIVTETTFQKDNLTGAAALWPEDFRNRFFGTHIDGPGFIGVVESSSFRIEAPWYVTPFGGYPASSGNSLRLRIEGGSGETLAEIACAEPNPGPGQTDIGFWAADVRSYSGQQARYVITDQRNDHEGWIALAPPRPAMEGSAEASWLRRAWAAEGSLDGLHSLQVIALASGVLALLAAGYRWSQQRNSPSA